MRDNDKIGFYIADTTGDGAILVGYDKQGFWIEYDRKYNPDWPEFEIGYFGNSMDAENYAQATFPKARNIAGMRCKRVGDDLCLDADGNPVRGN